MGELYILGLLRWLQPTSAALQAVERSACARCMQASSFIAHTAATASDALLPVSRPPSSSGYEPISPRSPRLFPYLPFPPSSQRLSDLGWGGSGGQQQAQQAAQAPAPQGNRLGGGQQPADAKAAAAAAAEARAAGGSGSK